MDILNVTPHDGMQFVSAFAEPYTQADSFVYFGHLSNVKKEEYFYLLTPQQARAMAEELILAADHIDPMGAAPHE